MENAAPAALRTARFWQPLVCLSLLACVGLSALATELALRSEALGIWMDVQGIASEGRVNEYKRQYLDTEDRITLQEIPRLDPSAGGVYFFGASNMKWAMRTPDLPPEQRRLIHNFGAGEGSPYFHRQFTEYLVRHKDILRAGPEKTLIVYGASFAEALPAADAPDTVFTNLWQRYGLYRYDFVQGIEPIGRGPFRDACALEKARATSFVQGLIDRAGRMAVPKALRRRKTEKNPEVYAEDYKERLGPDWENGIRRQREELQRWFEYLRARKMAFEVVLLPLASWHRRLPYPPVYRAMIAEFCATNKVPLIDLSGLATDEDFFDAIHVNQDGLLKTDAALMAVARAFLRKQGIWPQQSRVGRPDVVMGR